MKKILGLIAIMTLASSQISFSAKSDTDAAVQRLVKVAKQRQAQKARNAARGISEDVTVVPVEEIEEVTTTTFSPDLNEAARQKAEEAREAARQKAEEAKIQAAIKAAEEKEAARQKAEEAKIQAEAKAAKAREAAQKKAEAKKLRAQRKNMSESKMMDVEIQRIKSRVEKINDNIEKYHKTNEMLDQMEQRLDNIQNKMNY
ncbi:FAD-I family protein [Leptotrichia sp. oral taxon 879]|uniref:FAD-I family protein n=1 Tax=Leptotrichia sp. oral taxon 879 TaxID=1227267 RepID=UPI0003AE5600|nr:FAD-I family protein [Leptotrichia sp. oral taxon 879]ERK49547.1 hypothetical protein HMPREF1552_01704 [Leptotrichia sp. oral taxon 879 str. F0557]